MSTPKEDRRERKRKRARSEILSAARSVIRGRGVAACTIEAVAERADVSKPAVFYYFASKEALIRTLAIEDQQDEFEAVVAAIDCARPGPAVLTDFVRAFVAHYENELELFKVGYVWAQVLGVDPAVVEQTVSPSMVRLFDSLEKRLREEREAGRLKPDVDMRRLAVVAWMSGLGLLTTLSVCDSAGQRLLHPTDALLDTLCQTLVAGAFAA